MSACSLGPRPGRRACSRVARVLHRELPKGVGSKSLIPPGNRVRKRPLARRLLPSALLKPPGGGTLKVLSSYFVGVRTTLRLRSCPLCSVEGGLQAGVRAAAGRTLKPGACHRREGVVRRSPENGQDWRLSARWVWFPGSARRPSERMCLILRVRVFDTTSCCGWFQP